MKNLINSICNAALENINKQIGYDENRDERDDVWFTSKQDGDESDSSYIGHGVKQILEELETNLKRTVADFYEKYHNTFVHGIVVIPGHNVNNAKYSQFPATVPPAPPAPPAPAAQPICPRTADRRRSRDSRGRFTKCQESPGNGPGVESGGGWFVLVRDPSRL